ncbi:DUF4279 domain-containing protein [Coraliomargarita sp. SDUM461004]|uniref:DUF4279 domain-containing protein n=1 Tax=Thalassobacterium sedimentorum TaxID=3041258 RepID=A0ABU1ANV9_9BACT|nr:DUF4279 domain-containing protein [Coraliomargarita sp. SDUM461004]MDQ8196402.1 DUF4279 domain-containing protein [Coraliomargarita sp. SDUM461004]
MNTNEGRVYFALFGDSFDPDELTEFLGIEPTSVSRKGERIPDQLPKCSSWQISTDNIKNEIIDIYEMAESIVEPLQKHHERISEAMHRFNLAAVLQVVLWISDNEKHPMPAIGFETETIKFLAEIGASIDVDTYKH